MLHGMFLFVVDDFWFVSLLCVLWDVGEQWEVSWPSVGQP